MKRLFIGCLVSLFLFSCASSYRSCYQVFSVVPENAQLTGNGSPVFVTNDGLEFTYNFWGPYGKMRFIAYNSNNYDVVVDMTRSSFIRNTIAEDYYQGKQVEERVITGMSTSSSTGTSVGNQASVSRWNNYIGHSFDEVLSVGASESHTKQKGSLFKKEWETAIIYTEPKEVRIPAHSAKVFYTFDISNYMVSELGDIPNQVYSPMVYTKQNTPMIMRNRICVCRENGEPVYHNMNFYIGKVGNVESIDLLVSPINFYIPYLTNKKSVDNNDIQIKPIIPEKLKGGEEIIYKGVKCVVANIDNVNVTLVTCDGTKRNWNQAVDYCKSLGDEWILPSKSMIHAISSNVNNIVQSVRYWTNKSIDDTKAEAYSIRDNVVKVAPKTSEYYTLAITTLSLEKLMQQ